MRSWLSNKNLHHPLSVPLLLVAVVLVVYYPAMLSGIHSIDDPGIISFYSANFPLVKILQPGNGYYYRPLIELSFWLDNRLWGMEPSIMHLENILLHCANSLLVYFLARKVISGRGENALFIPLLAALLFALHPVNVEAVAWIAGRTDPLLALFVLSAFFFLLRWFEESRWHNIIAAIILFGAALLSKETALAFGAVVFLLVVAWPGTATARQRMTVLGAMAAPALLLVAIALLFQRGTSGLSRFIATTDIHVLKGLWDSLIAVGFYAMKLIVPVPLNFSITEVQPAYGLAGVALLPALWWMFRHYSKAGIFFISAFFMILPAVLISFKQVAWTPFAERYLYLPSAFYALGLSVLMQSVWKKFQRSIVFVMIAVLVVFVSLSVQRTMLWGNKLKFMQDAVAKSPGFGSLYNELGGLLLQQGGVEKAADAFATADRLNKRPSMRLLIKANLLGVQCVKGNYMGVRELFFQLFKEKKEAPADFLELLYKADSKRLVTLSGDDKIFLAEDLLDTLDLLNQKRYDPFWFYQSGKLALIIGNKDQALDFFRRSYNAAPVDAHYRGAAGTYIKRLGNVK